MTFVANVQVQPGTATAVRTRVVRTTTNRALSFVRITVQRGDRDIEISSVVWVVSLRLSGAINLTSWHILSSKCDLERARFG